jgi:hypothetical protein
MPVQHLRDDDADLRVARPLRPPRRPSLKEIPYDHVATFRLEGKAGNRVEDVINVSVDGAFVAVAIGYSFIPGRLPDRGVDVQNVLNVLVGRAGPGASLVPDVFVDPRVLAQCILARLCGIDFKYSIIDSSAGRELQNKAIHNIAGLGKADGDRPFRPMAKPMLFMPRSTIRIQVEEVSQGSIYVGAELFIVLHGYKILGYGVP